MLSKQSAFVCLTLLVASTPVARGDGFLHSRASDLATRDAEFQTAMDTVLGCGSSAADADSQALRLQAIEKALSSSWRALPKNQQGKVEWRMLRYVAHRYFMQQSSLFIRGFEPARQVNESHMGGAEILSKKVPLIVDKLISQRHATDGFTLQDGVAMIATLEQVIFDSESHLLETVYKQQKKDMNDALGHADLSALIEAYMVHWMIGDDDRTIQVLMRNKSLLSQAFPHWGEIKHFANGMVRSMEFQEQRSPTVGHGATLKQQYSFDNVHTVVGSITKTFASYWETECQMIKQSLVALDKTGTGRIALADFYGANSDGEWRFGESEAYLRELGALDESSAWRGKQVIIPNYLLGASNCIVTTPHYLVCCVNECEDVLDEIEEQIGGPMAQPSQIIPLVGKMSNFNDDKPNIDKALQNQLQRISEAHGGQVPLHGRLFAQWLHYAFPRECPFPHKVGSFSSLTPAEFGDFMASESEVTNYASRRGEEANNAIEEERLSQWSEEEELHADYAVHLSAPWEGGRGLMIGGAVAGLAAAMWLVGGKAGKASAPQQLGGFSYEPKAHFV
jgi:hypothetical protein